MRHRAAAQLVLVGVLLAACGGGDDEVTPAEPVEASDGGDASDAGEPSDGGDEGGAAEVTILDDDGRRFEPAEVSVAVGDAVTWTHEGGLPHTVTATDGAFDSGTLAGGDTFAFTAEEAGTFDYVCSIHPEMTGTVTVS